MRADDSPSVDRRPALALAACFAVFAGLRLWAFFAFGETVYAKALILDPRAYFAQAELVARGRWVQDLAFYLGPGWPYLMGVWFKAFGVSIAAGRALNLLISLATMVVLAMAGRRAAGPWGGVAAAGVWALYRPAVFQEQTLLMETSAAFTVAVLAWLWLLYADAESARRRWVLAAAIGGALGVSALFRSNTLAVAPVLALGAGWLARRASGWRSALGTMALMTGACVAAIAPATIHNWMAERVFIPVTSNLGINLWIGLGPEATGAYVTPPSTIGNDDVRGTVIAQQRLGVDHIDSKALSDFWVKDTMRSLTLGRAAMLTLRKLGIFFQHADYPQIYHEQAMAEEEALAYLRLPLLGSGHLTAGFFAALAILFAGRTARGTVLAAGAVALVASLLPFFVTGRYRVPLAPWLLLATIAAVPQAAAWWRSASAGARRNAAMGAVPLLALPWVFAFSTPALPEAAKWQWLDMRSTIQRLAGEREAALRTLREVNAIHPSAASLCGEGLLTEEMFQNFAAAAALYERAIPLEPHSAYIRFNAAQAQLRAGLHEKARRNYEEAVRLDKGMIAEAWYNLAGLRWQAGDKEGARAAMEEVLKRNPQDRDARAFLEQLGK